jgi:hypothetical protein
MISLIDYTQIAYIKDRNIMNNVVVTTEVLHQVRFKRNRGVLFLK